MPDTSFNPYVRFAEWLAEASKGEISDPNAMTLATATADGRPSARIVLLKGVDPEGASPRGFIFYTNLGSEKAEEIAANPHVALLFHWKTLKRQVRIEGKASMVAPQEADAYFATRPRISRLGAIASDQSRPLPDRATLEARVAALEARYPGDDIPRPPTWSGYRVVPERFEFWQDMPFRLHDRVVLTPDADGKGWRGCLLYP